MNTFRLIIIIIWHCKESRLTNVYIADFEYGASLYVQFINKSFRFQRYLVVVVFVISSRFLRSTCNKKNITLIVIWTKLEFLSVFFERAQKLLFENEKILFILSWFKNLFQELVNNVVLFHTLLNIIIKHIRKKLRNVISSDSKMFKTTFDWKPFHSSFITRHRRNNTD